MDRLWNWHKEGRRTDNIDSFIANLQKANSQNGTLLKHQMLEAGDISSSISVLLVMAAQSPNQTDKIVKAALEMNKYLNINYANLSKERFNAEKLTIPAMLDTLSPQIKETVKDPSLITKANILVYRAKQNIKQDNSSTRRDCYDNCVSAYNDAMVNIQNRRQSTGNQRQPTIIQQKLRNNKGPIQI